VANSNPVVVMTLRPEIDRMLPVLKAAVVQIGRAVIVGMIRDPLTDQRQMIGQSPLAEPINLEIINPVSP
jgi:hypothetical protein